MFSVLNHDTDFTGFLTGSFAGDVGEKEGICRWALWQVAEAGKWVCVPNSRGIISVRDGTNRWFEGNNWDNI